MILCCIIQTRIGFILSLKLTSLKPLNIFYIKDLKDLLLIILIDNFLKDFSGKMLYNAFLTPLQIYIYFIGGCIPCTQGAPEKMY